MNNKTTRNSFLLLVTAAVWGAAFLAQTVGEQTKGGICCGVALCISTNLQQVGILMGASAGKAGFLTAVYIWLVDSWTEAECKRDAGLLSDFCSNHFSAAAGTAKSKISR